jgi:hypothetical protein
LADLENLVFLDDSEATFSSELVFDQLDVETATVSGTLNVLGPAIVSDLGITGDITAGLLVINGLEAEIESLGEALILQPHALGDLEMMAGKVVVDTHGNLIVQGTITAEKIAVEEFKILGSESAGSAVLLAGETSVEVAAQTASDSAKILLTPTTLTDRILVVTKKEPSKFKVEITEPEEKEINFDWFIIQ